MFFLTLTKTTQMKKIMALLAVTTMLVACSVEVTTDEQSENEITEKISTEVLEELQVENELNEETDELNDELDKLLEEL
tara:strand:+ start:136 stop:372 length:237 start_codon:yes stop_codon:yes gene_type:complete